MVATPSVQLAAVIALFFMRKIAFYLFFSALCVDILLSLFILGLEVWIKQSGNPAYLIRLFALIAVCIYSWWLYKKGELL